EGELLTIKQAAAVLGIATSTVHRWLNDGFIAGEQLTPAAPWRIRLTEDLRARFVDEEPPGTSPCTRQCAFSAFLARPCCSVSSVASSKPSMSSGERRKACESRLYPLSPRCLTSLHKPEGSMKQLPSSPRGRRPRLPDGRETAAPPPLRQPAGRCVQRGRRRFPVEGRLRRSAPAPASLPSCRPDPARS